MSPVTDRVFYYSASTKQQDKKIISAYGVGSYSNSVAPIYADEKLTEKVGNAFVSSKITDNSALTPVLDLEITIVVSEGTIKYKYIRDSYKKITVDTEQTSGIFTKGTITRTFEQENNLQRVRKIVYSSTFGKG